LIEKERPRTIAMQAEKGYHICHLYALDIVLYCYLLPSYYAGEI